VETQDYDKIHREGMARYGFGPEAMKQIKVCQKCGAMSPASKKLCVACKSILPSATLYQFYKSRHLFCNKCKTVVPNDTIYCPICGTKFEK